MQQPISKEFEARFLELEKQRNNALNQSVIYAGIIAALQEKIALLEQSLTPTEKVEEA